MENNWIKIAKLYKLWPHDWASIGRNEWINQHDIEYSLVDDIEGTDICGKVESDWLENTYSSYYWYMLIKVSKENEPLIRNVIRTAMARIKNAKLHFFTYNKVYVIEVNGRTLPLVYDTFKDTNVDIQPDIINFAKKLEDYNNNPVKYFPSLTDNGIHNVDSTVVKNLENKLGPVNDDNMFQYIDRAYQYGILRQNIHTTKSLKEIFTDVDEKYGRLTRNIVNRSKPLFTINESERSLEHVLETLLVNLKRYPLMIYIPHSFNAPSAAKNYLYFVKKIVDATSNFITPDEISVTFRMSNKHDHGREFNDYMTSMNINNSITDENSKILVIKKLNVFKPLIKNNRYPDAFMTIGSKINSTSNHDGYTNSCDLLIDFITFEREN